MFLLKGEDELTILEGKPLGIRPYIRHLILWLFRLMRKIQIT
ncbi:hypothetical protein LEP1GSC185_0815 [Leptospira licerasiae serovar Varillal str. VAR 010]|nr:hypothetical protein LEP1GSC185_0815 [Leptospira licerasiae serovar Varillal str. VAR 010]